MTRGIPHRVAVEAAKPGQTEEPAQTPDPHVVDRDPPLVEPERIETRLGPSQRGLRL
jgi:hypothetical protein